MVEVVDGGGGGWRKEDGVTGRYFKIEKHPFWNNISLLVSEPQRRVLNVCFGIIRNKKSVFQKLFFFLFEKQHIHAKLVV